MKRFFRTVYITLKGIGYAKTAADLARNGKHEEAKKLMAKYGDCK
jgi:hypothetical protein